jgi:hypothetical protein
MKKEKLKLPSRGKSSRRGMTRWREPRTEFLFPDMSENPWRIVARKPRNSAITETTVESLTTLELCAGAGGQALGLEQAGLEHAGLVELDSDCATLRMNRPSWNVIEEDLNHFDGRPFKGVDVISGGLPCPPFSVAGKQLGISEEHNLFSGGGNFVNQVKTWVSGCDRHFPKGS